MILEAEAVIPIQDRGFLFGDGVFTTIKVENGLVVQVDLHLERIQSHCQRLNINPPNLTKEVLKRVIQKNGASSGIWRLKVIITGGNSSVLHLPKRDFGVCLVTIKPYTPPSKLLRVCQYPHPVVGPLINLKTLSYLERLVIKQYAIDRGFDDAVVCSIEGYVLETAFSNLYWKDEETYFTPDLTLPLLQGTHLASISGVRQSKTSYEELKEKEDVYLCNAMSVIKIAEFSECNFKLK